MREQLKYLVFIALIAATLTIHYYLFEISQMPISLALVFPIVVASVWHSGLYAGLITSAMVATYSFLILGDIIRASMITGSLLLTVIPVSILKSQAERIGSVANLLYKLREIHSVLLAALVNWPDMEDEEKWNIVEGVNSKIADILTITRGWHLLAKERNSLEVGREE